MCLIKKVTTFHSDGRSNTTETLLPCSNSDRIRACDNAQVEEYERGPGKSSQMVLRPSSSKNQEVVLHQNTYPPRQEPRPERRYAGEIGVRLRGWRSPIFSVRRLDDGGSGSGSGFGSRRRHRDGEGWSSGEMMPEAPMPPPPRVPQLHQTVHHSQRRSPPPSVPPMLITPPNRPTPPQGPSGAAVGFATIDTVPQSSGTPSRASSSRSKDAHRAVQGLPQQMVPVSGSSVTSNRSHRVTQGLSHLRFDTSTRFRDSAYGSNDISPIDATKSDRMSETRSNTTSERSANERHNYANDKVVARRESYENDDEDIKSNSSGGRKDYRIVRRIRGHDDEEETDRKMQEIMNEAKDYQSRTSEQGEGSVRSGSGSGRRRHRRRRVSDE
jgi:hypothetical protein